VSVEVRWRDGRRTHIAAARPNRLYEIDEATATTTDAPNTDRVVDSLASALFTDATTLLGGHAHAERLFDDYTRQPLLPNRFSQLGPGLSWIDVDSDGREDLIVAAGRGAGLSLLRNTASGFVRQDGPAVAGDLGTVLPVQRAGRVWLLASQSNYEAAALAEALAVPRVLAYPTSQGRPAMPLTIVAGDSATVGAMALGDVDGDGILDLFVGSRVLPGAWPLPARSRLYRGTMDGSFTEDATHDQVLKALGLVTAATFADVTGDGRSDLVVASEWGPVRVLVNENGRLQDATERLGLAGVSSRWLGVTAGDFDGDGQLDLVATSWGRNVPWRATAEHPHALWVSRAQDRLALVTAEFDPTTGKEMPVESFARLSVAMPDLRRRIGTYADYAQADLATVLGERAATAVRVGATTFDHTLFINKGGHFEVRPLPPAAQLAPASGPVVGDFNGDGREDLFLSQNFFPTEIGTMRFDAGAGLLLLGDGSGGFAPLSVRRSGIAVLGDQRGAAVADFDGDARLDLAVSQNGTFTRLFRNQSGRPGLRVRLEGGPGNPLGIGTQLRVVSGARRGPVREVRAGTGYWSMDGAVSVLGLPNGADSIWKRWPGGEVTTLPIPPGAKELRVNRR
ncbi:MAG: FG-GAP repeat domain-containing protein, partial [Gemmatimonadaceae bacterium]